VIGLEYILNLYEVQHQELAEKLGIKKQNINLWIKGKQAISKRYLPILKEMFGIEEELFQKEVDEIDRLIIQKEKLKNEIHPVAGKFELKLSLDDEPDLIQIPIYSSEEMNEIEFEIEKEKLIKGFREIILQSKDNYELGSFEQIQKLYEKYNDDPILRYMIEAISHYFNVLPDWVGDPRSDEFVEEFIELANKYFQKD